uniref:Uncharacterized protein n=1 Tax=Anguilla anguilla TaxID=7936 RepID=A0A0E9WQ26_ANGAN
MTAWKGYVNSQLSWLAMGDFISAQERFDFLESSQIVMLKDTCYSQILDLITLPVSTYSTIEDIHYT